MPKATNQINTYIGETTDLLRSHAQIHGIDLEYWQLAQRRVKECRYRFLTSEHSHRTYKLLEGYQSYLERWVFEFAEGIEENDREIFEAIAKGIKPSESSSGEDLTLRIKKLEDDDANEKTESRESLMMYLGFTMGLPRELAIPITEHVHKFYTVKRI